MPGEAELWPSLTGAETTAIEASLVETEVANAEEAARVGMAGSPTVLIDGHDPFAPQGGGSLACRLYRVGDRLDGAPSVAQLLEALTAAPEADSGLAGALIDLLGQDLDEVDQALATNGFVAVWDRRARRPEDLVPGVTGAGPAAVALARRGRAELDEAGALVGIHGLTLRLTRHQFAIEGRPDTPGAPSTRSASPPPSPSMPWPTPTARPAGDRLRSSSAAVPRIRPPRCSGCHAHRPPT